MKDKLRTAYRRAKHSNVWRTNRAAAAVYPFVRFGGKSVRKVYVVGKRAKQQTLKRVRSINREDIKLQRARNAANKKQWKQAKKYYSAVLALEKKKPLKLEVKNEVKTQLSLINRILGLGKYKRQIDQYNARKKRPKIAVFTAISGGYDTVKLPQVLNPEFDYILFTDAPAKGSGVFQVRPMPYFNADPTRMARFVKTHPHQLLKGYDYAIWIDANIVVLNDIMPMFKKFAASKKPLGAVQHPHSNSIHEEEQRCLRYNKEDAAVLRKQVEHYETLGFESDQIVESNIMMFDLRKGRLDGFFTTWWAEIDSYSKRDQVSLPYALHQNDIAWHRLMKRPFDARNHPDFALVPHHVRQNALYELENLLGSKDSKPLQGTSFFKNKDKLLANKLLDKKQIDIIYCVHNALEDVKICLDSVAKNHAKNERLIIVDDGSGEETKTFLEQFANKHKSWTRIIRTETGSGYTKAANRGLRASTGDLMILLNSDTITTSNWTRKMAQAVYTTPGAGMVGPLSSAASYQSVPNTEHTSETQTATNDLPHNVTAENMNINCEHWSVAGVAPIVPLLHGFCLGIRREVIDAVGYFDEESFPFGYGEEDDYCCRAINAGFNLVVATNTYIFHAKSKSYTNDNKRAQLMKNGREAKYRKWGEHRFRRAVQTMQQNPILQNIRQKAKKFYDKSREMEDQNRKNVFRVLKKYYGYTPSVRAGRKIKIDLVLQKSGTRPTSSAFIRLISPLTDKKVRDQVDFKIHDGKYYVPQKNTDVCIVQRTAVETLEKAIQITEALKAQKTKLIVDIDDAFANIEPSHPEYAVQSAKNEALNYLVDQSDLLLVSSKKIAEEYKPGKYSTIPNSLDYRVWSNKSVKTTQLKNSPIRIIYMGTPSHTDDLNMVMPALDKLAKKYPGAFNLTTVGVGKIPKRGWIEDITSSIPSTMYPEFVEWFQKQGPFDIGIAPLTNTRFNQQKSDIKCLDYIAVGAVPMVSSIAPYTNTDLREFIISGGMRPDEWQKALGVVVRDPEAFRRKRMVIIPKAQKFAENNRASSKTALLLLKQIKETLSS